VTIHAPVLDHMPRLRQLLDNNRGYGILNNPELRQAMRDFVKGAGSVTRPDIAAQAFCFAIELERERTRAMLQLGTWPCHDHPDPDAVLAELLAAAQRAPAT
jgi:hypothetical protein